MKNIITQFSRIFVGILFIISGLIKLNDPVGFSYKLDEDETGEFIGIINYCIMALIQLDLGVVDQPDLGVEKATQLYDEKVTLTKNLMEAKNHDYGEAWREMRVSSLTDLILQKLLRVKQIEDNKGKTLVSEGIDANYQDMINYAVFALILMKK